MNPTWILVCGRVQASLFERKGTEPHLTMVAEFLHPEGRLKEGQISIDRAGRRFDTVHLLGNCLKQGVEHRRSGKLYIAAGKGFSGLLKGELDPRTRTSVAKRIEKDLEKLPEREILPRSPGTFSPDAAVCLHTTSPQARLTSFAIRERICAGATLESICIKQSQSRHALLGKV